LTDTNTVIGRLTIRRFNSATRRTMTPSSSSRRIRRQQGAGSTPPFGNRGNGNESVGLQDIENSAVDRIHHVAFI
jgi:hypothetical protein